MISARKAAREGTRMTLDEEVMLVGAPSPLRRLTPLAAAQSRVIRNSDARSRPSRKISFSGNNRPDVAAIGERQAAGRGRVGGADLGVSTHRRSHVGDLQPAVAPLAAGPVLAQGPSGEAL